MLCADRPPRSADKQLHNNAPHRKCLRKLTTACVSLFVFFTARRGTFPYSVEDDSSNTTPATHYTNTCVKLTIVTHLSYSERIAIANLSLITPPHYWKNVPGRIFVCRSQTTWDTTQSSTFSRIPKVSLVYSFPRAYRRIIVKNEQIIGVVSSSGSARCVRRMGSRRVLSRTSKQRQNVVPLVHTY